MTNKYFTGKLDNYLFTII